MDFEPSTAPPPSPTDGRRGDDAEAAWRPPPERAEVALQPLDKRVRVLWWCAGALMTLPPLAAVALLDRLVPHPLPPRLLSWVALAAAVVLVGLVPVLRYRRWRYALRSDDLWIRRGLLTVTVSVIPYRRLQFVDTRQGPLDRLFGLAQLVVHTAAVGTSGRLPGLAMAEAERLREVLSQLEPDDEVV